jgi:hypothetical protein
MYRAAIPARLCMAWYCGLARWLAVCLGFDAKHDLMSRPWDLAKAEAKNSWSFLVLFGYFHQGAFFNSNRR